MATKKKLLQAAAGAAGGEALNVEEVFSTYLWDGTGGFGERTIANGIDLDGEGGLVWVKDRQNAQSHGWYDTERGATKYLQSNTTDAEVTVSLGVTSFKTNGFGVDYSHNNADYASWTFRKAPKFFDVVTYTGTGSAQTISHNLGSVPGAIIVKRTDTTSDWSVYHTSLGATKRLRLNSTATPQLANVYWNYDSPTSTEFTVGTHSSINASGGTYVAYLFAHNDGDGEFGPDADADIIKCGSYTGNGSTDGPEIDLGFEPQWILIKNTTTSNTAWSMWDNMRGVVTGGNDAYFMPSASSAESSYNGFAFNATGFKVENTAGFINTNGNTYIYIAIRRGPMAVPTDATDVFDIDTRAAASGGTPAFTSGFVTDFGFTRRKSSTGSWEASSRLTQGQRNWLNLTNAEGAEAEMQFDYMDGFNAATGANSDILAWMWKRAPSFFDVVAYTGNGTAGHTVSHNLGVAPEMMWVKRRSAADNWRVYHPDIGINYKLGLDSSAAASYDPALWNGTSPTDTNFTVGSDSSVNGSGYTYIAYLFASLDGVSKVGSFSHTNGGGDTNVDCGFSSGARFVLYKQYDSSGSWYVLDSTRGIVAGNDPALLLNSTAAEDSSYDQIDPYSSGFTIPSDGVGTGDYIFYAIA